MEIVYMFVIEGPQSWQEDPRRQWLLGLRCAVKYAPKKFELTNCNDVLTFEWYKIKFEDVKAMEDHTGVEINPMIDNERYLTHVEKKYP